MQRIDATRGMDGRTDGWMDEIGWIDSESWRRPEEENQQDHREEKTDETTEGWWWKIDHLTVPTPSIN
jgi:hypothetical protein